jgi:hypothetical protein
MRRYSSWDGIPQIRIVWTELEFNHPTVHFHKMQELVTMHIVEANGLRAIPYSKPTRIL